MPPSQANSPSLGVWKWKQGMTVPGSPGAEQLLVALLSVLWPQRREAGGKGEREADPPPEMNRRESENPPEVPLSPQRGPCSVLPWVATWPTEEVSISASSRRQKDGQELGLGVDELEPSSTGECPCCSHFRKQAGVPQITQRRSTLWPRRCTPGTYTRETKTGPRRNVNVHSRYNSQKVETAHSPPLLVEDYK